MPDRISRAKARIFQNVWREKVLENFNYKCCVCGLSVKELLEAAHIIPWSQDPHNRLNPYNGLCLCPIHHKAYDLGWLVIDDTLTIYWSPPEAIPEDDITREYFKKYHGKTILLPRRLDGLKEMLRKKNQC